LTNDLIYQLALTQIPNIGYVHAKLLIQAFGTAKDIFTAKRSDLERLEGIGVARARNIKKFSNFNKAEQEIAFIEKYGIQTFFLNEPNYPKRLLNCYDPPTLLFYKGSADLDVSHCISIVGTRNNTEYGKHFTEKFVRELSDLGVLVISGLAAGIDTIAHKAALKNGLATVGVLAHGLDSIYPPENTDIARSMIKNGGLLTELFSKTLPDKHNFPSRNRIVAGLSDATIVIETGIKGGSMITADLANSYNRDTFAVPGKVSDQKSAGCNYLIQNNKAILLTDAEQLATIMNWSDRAKKMSHQQRELFTDCTPNEKLILDIIKEKETISIDDLNLQSGLSSSAVAAATLNLELHHIIQSLPGKIYRLV
jgi:DNA processing protein